MASRGEKIHTGIMVGLLGLGGWIMFRGTKARAAARKSTRKPAQPGDETLLAWAQHGMELAEADARTRLNLKFTRLLESEMGQVQGEQRPDRFPAYAFDLYETDTDKFALLWVSGTDEQIDVGVTLYSSMTGAQNAITDMRRG